MLEEIHRVYGQVTMLCSWRVSRGAVWGRDAAADRLDRTLTWFAVEQELSLTGSACSCYSSTPSYPSYRLVARVSHPVPTSLPQFSASSTCMPSSNPQSLKRILSTCRSIDRFQQSGQGRPRFRRCPPASHQRRFLRGRKFNIPDRSSYTYNMVSVKSSLLDRGADDLEVRGDEAIKRLFAKYDTFLFDVGLSLCLSLALSSPRGRADRRSPCGLTL